MIRRLWKTLKLGFDRSFSGASWKQITWLFGILALVLGFSLWIKSYCTAELHDMRILELLLDPGSFVLQDGDPLGYERLPLLALTFLGAIFFTGGSRSSRTYSRDASPVSDKAKSATASTGISSCWEPTTRPQD